MYFKSCAEFLFWLDAQLRVNLVSRVEGLIMCASISYIRKILIYIFDDVFRGLVEYTGEKMAKISRLAQTAQHTKCVIF